MFYVQCVYSLFTLQPEIHLSSRLGAGHLLQAAEIVVVQRKLVLRLGQEAITHALHCCAGLEGLQFGAVGPKTWQTRWNAGDKNGNVIFDVKLIVNWNWVFPVTPEPTKKHRVEKLSSPVARDIYKSSAAEKVRHMWG